MFKMLHKHEILAAIDSAFRELESQKYALDQSAIVAITDVKGNIIYVNDQFCQISKYTERELLGQNHRIINSGYHPPEFFTEMWKTIAKGKVWRADIKNRAKDGSYYWVATTITPYLNEKGKPHTYVSIRFDITKQKELELELAEKLMERTQMLTHLSNQNKQLEDFCHIISHNLRAPLANLSLLGELIESSQTTAEKLSNTDKLKAIISSLQEIFDELVEGTQIRMDYEIKRDKVRLAQSFERAKKTLQGEITTTNAIITSNFKEAEFVKFPKKYVDSIIFNLVSNAIKYRSPKKRPEVHVRSYVKDDIVFLEVADNGLGIDLRLHGDKIFKLRKVFHKHPDSRGVGLFITKTQVEAMGGEIWVNSKVNKGTCFTVKLCTNYYSNEKD